MVKFILKRIGTMIIAMFMIILITFTLMHSIPGGPFTNTKGVPEEVTQAMEAKYGLDQPMPVQFVKYLGSLLHGDFGPSYKYTGKTVNDFIATGATVSAKLGLVTLVFVLLTSIPMGILAALKNGKWQDMLLMAIATIGALALAIYENGDYIPFTLAQKIYLGKSLAEIADMQQNEKSESANWKRQELQAQIDLMNDIMQIADNAERGISDKGKISPQIQRGRTIARAQEHMSMIDLLTAEQEEHFNDR